MSAGARAWFAAGAPTLALVVVCMAMALAMLWGSARERDQAFADTSSRLVESAWGARVNATAGLALDYAIWNDAYLATTVEWDGEWIDNNLYSNLVDAILVVRADGAVRHAWFADAVGAEAPAITAGVVEAVRRDLNLGALVSAPLKEDMKATTVLAVEGDPVLVAIAPLSPEEQTVRQVRDPDLQVDFLVAVDRVSSQELNESGASVEAVGLNYTVGGPSGGDDQILMPLLDASGQNVGALAWTRQRPGSAAFAANAGLIVICLLLVGALALMLARKLVDDHVRAAAEISSAQEASRIKSEFIGAMSHELRTPLNAIIGYAELIKEEVEDKEAEAGVIADADRILSAASHLARLISDVLDQSRIEAGKLNVVIEPVAVAGALEDLEELMRPLAQANANRLTISAEADAGLVMADPMRLQQCLINLTGNALKFTRGGDVAVRVRRLHDGSQLSFDVSDTGIGMDKRELERLFKPFAQANSGVSIKYGGTGLGLSITRSLARAMGGDVSVQSALGKGSVFSLRLPAGAVEVTAKPVLIAAA
ncbi:MAG TPA: ATP-binding protein [Vitreimonas sp.]|uniref:ATP-binding protein n=1 Tax=Vitreimonas sp. TaxID=3069702 RepID=UPI002D50F823|nr:ATP-binding protein [Vitreimonas sp.]HYD86063.1 ATP-binding protein [Vitreimonas sp.]